jgi:hypothetical protein
MLITAGAGQFVPQDEPYVIELLSAYEDAVAVVNGHGFVQNFDIINRGSLFSVTLNSDIILAVLRIDISNSDGSLYGPSADGKTDYYVYDQTRNILTILNGNEHTIWQSDGYHSLDGMIIASDTTVTIDGVTLEGNIVLQTSSVTLGLSGSSTVMGSILVPEGTALTIDSPSSPGSSDGSLTVTASDRYSAGIGGGYGQNAGMITMNGGTVTAYGGKYAAGIGGGYGGNSGTITMNGGSVTAYGGDYGAAIGGGYGGDGGPVTIGGSDVTVSGGKYGTGIGGGYGGRYDGPAVTANDLKNASKADTHGELTGAGYGIRTLRLISVP